MVRHPRTSPMGGSSPPLVPRPHGHALHVRMRNFGARAPPGGGKRWRRPASQRRCTGMWAAAPSAMCTSPQRTLFCCWTHSKRRRPSSRGARRARVPAGEGSGVLERRRRRTKARTVAALPARRQCRPAWGQLTPEYCNWRFSRGCTLSVRQGAVRFLPRVVFWFQGLRASSPLQDVSFPISC